jgi:hypothetical protein
VAVTYPGALWRPLGDQTEPSMDGHDIICLHTMVGYLTSTDAMFKQNGYGGTESHFGIGGKWGGDLAKGYDGKVFQWQDLNHTADANLNGNHHVISIETADNAPQSASNLAAWTSAQKDAIVDLVVWLCRKYSIPPILVKDSKPGRRGIAYHHQGIEHSDGVDSHPGWLVSGGERWSSVVGKECPGNARIKQLREEIIPRVQDILNGDEEMQTADFNRIQTMIANSQEDILKALPGIIQKVLANTDFVENRPTKAMLAQNPDAKGVLAPPAWFWSTTENDQDNDRNDYLIPILNGIIALVDALVPKK